MLHDLDEAQCCCLIALVGLARAATVVVEVAETSEEREWRRYLERKTGALGAKAAILPNHRQAVEERNDPTAYSGIATD